MTLIKINIVLKVHILDYGNTFPKFFKVGIALKVSYSSQKFEVLIWAKSEKANL